MNKCEIMQSIKLASNTHTYMYTQCILKMCNSSQCKQIYNFSAFQKQYQANEFFKLINPFPLIKHNFIFINWL